MDYYEIDEKRILALMDGLHMIERLNSEKAAELALHLYGITSDPGVLSAAKATVIDSLEEFYDEEGETTLSEEEVAIAEVGMSAFSRGLGCSRCSSSDATIAFGCIAR